MKIEDIIELKRGSILKCVECGKKLIVDVDKIHFIGGLAFIDGTKEIPLTNQDKDEVSPTCEECHNKIFGEDEEKNGGNKDL